MISIKLKELVKIKKKKKPTTTKNENKIRNGRKFL